MLIAARKLSVSMLGSRRALVGFAALLVLLVAVAALLVQAYVLAGARAAPPATPDPLTMDVRQVMPVSKETAAAINARVPVARDAVASASPFSAAFAAADERTRALHCLTQAIYYEAANEPDGGQSAVAQVILNRVRHPAFPNSVCGVVYQGSNRRTGCQFTFTCDGSLARRPSSSGWERARRAAAAALAGSVYAPVGTSTHYHANYVVPYWASSLVKTAVVGAHIFYRWSGRAGLPRAFTDRYAGLEPIVSGRIPAAETASADLPAEITAPVLENPALAPLATAIPEERADEMDRFGLLDYRRPGPATASPGAPSATASSMRTDDARMAEIVGAAAARSRPAAAPTS